MSTFNVDDQVQSNGRIQVAQDMGDNNIEKRFINFVVGTVVELGPEGIAVNPQGKRAIVVCQPEDLSPVGPGQRPKPPPEPVPGMPEKAEEKKPSGIAAARKRSGKAA